MYRSAARRFRTYLLLFYSKARQSLLKNRPFDFLGRGGVNLIDVGSSKGLPPPWVDNPHRINHVLSFDPQDEQAHTKVSIGTALWSEPGIRDFYIYRGRGGSGSSLFQQNFDYVQANFESLHDRGSKSLAETWSERSSLERVEQIECQRLDDVLDKLDQPFPYHFIKIDTQGAEFQILQGAEKFLSVHCIGLHLELFVIPLYKGIKLLPDVVDYLGYFDFELIRKDPAHGSFASQHNCLFLKRDLISCEMDTVVKVYGL